MKDQGQKFKDKIRVYDTHTRIHVNIFGVMVEGSIDFRMYWECTTYYEKKKQTDLSDDMVVHRWGGWDSPSGKCSLECVALSFSGSPLFCSFSGLCLIVSVPQTDYWGNQHCPEWYLKGDQEPSPLGAAHRSLWWTERPARSLEKVKEMSTHYNRDPVQQKARHPHGICNTYFHIL